MRTYIALPIGQEEERERDERMVSLFREGKKGIPYLRQAATGGEFSALSLPACITS